VSEIRVELLIGRKVHDVNGKKVGRIEEIRGEKRESDFLVEAYLVGTSALVERLAAWTLVRPIRGMLGKSVYSMYRIPWNEMDLSDPHHPKLTIPKSELRRVPV
jgi:sporulation protein YlmC with PRC-barrel domain